MKGKTNTGVAISENEILPIGAEVEIISTQYDRGVYYHTCVIPGGRRISINASSVDIKDYTLSADWDTIRREFIGRAMQGILSGTSDPTNTIDPKSVAEGAIAYADALIEELKKKKKGD